MRMRGRLVGREGSPAEGGGEQMVAGATEVRTGLSRWSESRWGEAADSGGNEAVSSCPKTPAPAHLDLGG